jgi:glycosyltransferase involved in cell wall biosynthesis
MNRNSDPRVLHVVPNVEHGGAQEMLCTLAESRRPTSGFFVCSFSPGHLQARLAAAASGLAVVPGPRIRFTQPVGYAAELRRIHRALADLVEEWRVDIVQTHLLTVLDAVVMRLRTSARRPPIVWTFHGPDFLPLRPGPSLPMRRLACRWFYRAMAHKVDAIVAVSDATRDAVVRQLGPAAAGTRVIRNAPNPRKFQSARPPEATRAALGLDSDSRVVLFVGRLAPEKGCRHLVEAMGAVCTVVPGAVALLAGEGPDRASLDALARRTTASNRIRFLGARDDVGDLLAAADVVCLPSLREGLSLALLEARAAGRPIVATDVAGNRAALEAGTTALLVSPGDSAALAEALITLLSDPRRAAAIGRAARARAQGSESPEDQWELFSALYGELLAASTPR